jgi:vacuolar-type H+-ATPase subunit I/STV1
MEAAENIGVVRRDNVTNFRQIEDSDDTSVHSLDALLDRVLETSTVEIDHLIDQLQTLQRKLEGDGDRIQTDIANYAALSEQVMQVTKVVSESVQMLPEAPSVRG